MNSTPNLIRITAIVAALIVLSGTLFVSGCLGKNPGVSSTKSGLGSDMRISATTTTQAPPTSTTMVPTTTLAPRQFSVDGVLAHTRALTSFGPRVEGTESERAAFDYAQEALEAAGHTVSRQTFVLPNKRLSHNLVVDVPGAVYPQKVLILGAHIDSVPSSPGANDNALGVAILLELAEVLKRQAQPCTVRLIVFGAEEYGNKKLDRHHFGSRYYAARLKPEEIPNIVGMVSVDMVGYGASYKVRSLGRGPRTLCDAMISNAHGMSMNLAYETKPEWSDHEPFEKLGIPSAWLYAGKDPRYHTRRDTADRLSRENIELMGLLLVQVIGSPGVE